MHQYKYCLYDRTQFLCTANTHNYTVYVQIELTQQTLGALLVMSSLAVPTKAPTEEQNTLLQSVVHMWHV